MGAPPANRFDELLDRTVIGSFTNVGYALRKRRWVDDLPSLDGKTVVVTGATSGLGRVAAEKMAGLGASIRLVGRSQPKLEIARREISTATANDDLGVYVADHSDMGSVRGLAAALLAGEPAIDVLVNNAGALVPNRTVTAEGNELTLATNLLSHFLLTNLLIPRLQDSAPARIINVSSGGMYTQRIRVGDLQSERGEYKGSIAYARAKRGQVILTELWAEQLAARGVVVHAMHPGWADTPGVETSLPMFHKLTRPFLRTPEQGADTIVWLAASKEAGESSGLFWLDRSPRPVHRLKTTIEAHADRRGLWEGLNKLANASF
ncbi:MAG TPA: SDR family NAD(P)-dependent oxidoreductase [Acidimicrobiia bacterium]|nr:SDR family NAD(P)-dependent oxidoreductase [Acidimicrobiia bacterium]